MGNYSLNFARPKLPTRILSTCLLAKFRGKGGLITLHALLRTGLPYTFRGGQIASLPFFRLVKTRTVLLGPNFGRPLSRPFPPTGRKIASQDGTRKIGGPLFGRCLSNPWCLSFTFLKHDGPGSSFIALYKRRQGLESFSI